MQNNCMNNKDDSSNVKDNKYDIQALYILLSTLV